MTWEPATSSGELLWKLLPEVYRNRDGTYGRDPKRPDKALQQRGDLANYLDAYGVLLDQVKNTILQRLGDTSPETCQEWLIPYFADLLDVHLVSPDIEGQRMEVARAISWRQRKGTIGCIREIATEVGRYEKTVPMPAIGDKPVEFESIPTVVVQEGFKRVATTARIGTPLPSLYSLGLTVDAFDSSEHDSPVRDATHPGIPAGTLDFRYLSRATEVSGNTPLSQAHAFSGQGSYWQQQYPRGMPCDIDTYQDVSVRTVDLRSPTWQHGHYHPHRTLLYSEPREGFFSATRFTLDWDSDLWPWIELFDSFDDNAVEFVSREENKIKLYERELPRVDFGGKTICLIERRHESMQGDRQRIIGIELTEAVTEQYHRREQVGTEEILLKSGFELIEEETEQTGLSVSLRGFGEETPGFTAGSVDLSNLFGASHFVLQDLICETEIDINQATLQIKRSAIQKLNMTAPSLLLGAATEINDTALSITDSLLNELHMTGSGGCRLEYCTVLSTLDCSHFEASDSILLDTIDPDSFNQIFIRYSALPALMTTVVNPDKGRIYADSVTQVDPIFMNYQFGEPGCGVIHPAATFAIRHGAEDGGEMGCFHHRHYVLREQAVVDKLKEFLPVTQEPVLIVHRNWNSPVALMENQ